MVALKMRHYPPCIHEPTVACLTRNFIAKKSPMPATKKKRALRDPKIGFFRNQLCSIVDSLQTSAAKSLETNDGCHSPMSFYLSKM
jgi:hypothetical protein